MIKQIKLHKKCTGTNITANLLSLATPFHNFSHGKLSEFAFILHLFIIMTSDIVFNNPNLNLAHKSDLFDELTWVAVICRWQYFYW